MIIGSCVKISKFFFLFNQEGIRSFHALSSQEIAEQLISIKTTVDTQKRINSWCALFDSPISDLERKDFVANGPYKTMACKVVHISMEIRQINFQDCPSNAS